MAFSKTTFVDNQTVIDAATMNAIQDELIRVAGLLGKDIQSAVINDSGHLILTLTDGTTLDAGVAKGAKGDPGAVGLPGLVIGSTRPTAGNHPVWLDISGDEVDTEGLGITGATVDQIAKISAVDDNGNPTAWEPVDMPSGGAAEEYELIFADTVTEDAAGYSRDTDANGNTFALKKAILIVFTPPYDESDTSYGRCVGFVPTVRWGHDKIGSLRDPIKSSAGGTGRYEVIFAEVIMGYQVCTAKFESQNTTNAFSVMQGVISAGTTGLQFVSDATKLMQFYNPTGNMTCVKIAGYASPIIAKNTQIKLYGVRA